MARREPVTVAISAVNFTGGGPLTVLLDCLRNLREAAPKDWRIVALVNDVKLVEGIDVEAIAAPWATRSWLSRLRAEWFGGLSNLVPEATAWISMHDITPKTKAKVQFVYCHNTAPFYRPSLRELTLAPYLLAYIVFYPLVYGVGISKNRAVIVQQDQLRRIFKRQFGCRNVWVARPTLPVIQHPPSAARKSSQPFVFFYPAFPRVFKNHEALAKAAKFLSETGAPPFEVWLTCTPDENRYIRAIFKEVDVPQVRWMGRMNAEQIHDAYAASDVVVFPSKLETWGLPISEAKQFGKPILLADLPYAHETLGDYDRAAFFPPNDAAALAALMLAAMTGGEPFVPHKAARIESPYFQDWRALARALVKEVADAA
jgi:glycosyltransferase involved in cell wall biosynthesis